MNEDMAQLRAEVAALNKQVAQNKEATAFAITHLEGAIAEFIEHPLAAGSDTDEIDNEEEEAPEAVAWVDHATAKEWVGLCDWVDWLSRTYELHDDARRVRPCWPAHTGVAEELAALRSAWREAARRARDTDTDALAFWHDRYLAPFIARMNTLYTTQGCSTKHENRGQAKTTDRTLINVRSAADPSDPVPEEGAS